MISSIFDSIGLLNICTITSNLRGNAKGHVSEYEIPPHITLPTFPTDGVEHLIQCSVKHL